MLRTSAMIVALNEPDAKPLSAQAMLTRLLSVLETEGVITKCVGPDAASIEQHQIANIWIGDDTYALHLFYLVSNKGREVWDFGVTLPLEQPVGLGPAPELVNNARSKSILQKISPHVATPFVGEVSTRWFARDEVDPQQLPGILRGETELGDLKFGAEAP